MSWLSKVTGIGISPKGIKIDPLRAIGTVAGLATGGVGSALMGAAKGALGSAAVRAIGGGSSAQPTPGISSAIPDEAFGLEERGGLGGLVGKAGDFLKGNNGKNALGVLQGLNAAMQQKKANDLANSALRGAEGMYAERAPLRAAGMRGLLNPQAPDLAPLRSTIYTGNPYAMGGQ